MRISIVGLGKLGSPMAAVFAARGHEVTGLDVNPQIVSALQAGRAPTDEPRLQEMLDQGRSRLTITQRYDEVVERSDLSFIIVPTPSDRSGVFSNAYVVQAVAGLGAALRDKAGYHVVVVTSTVMPGAMEHVIRPALEQASDTIVGQSIGLCYNPEFIALGSVVNNMLEPDFLLIGESDARAGELVASVYQPVCLKQPPAKRMNFVNAELAKIAVNTFVTTKISYANMLADVCDRLPGADVDIVAEAVGSDSRIGRKYLRGAVGYGGPCFPRDNIAFASLASQLGAHADIARATDTINRYQIERVTTAVRTRVAAPARVAVLGMSYKPDTATIEESQGVMLAQRLLDLGYHVIVHDPVSTQAALDVLGPQAVPAPTPQGALEQADIAVLMTPWPQYAGLETVSLGKRLPVIDCWRMLKGGNGAALELIWLGFGHAVPVPSAL